MATLSLVVSELTGFPGRWQAPLRDFISNKHNWPELYPGNAWACPGLDCQCMALCIKIYAQLFSFKGHTSGRIKEKLTFSTLTRVQHISYQQKNFHRYCFLCLQATSNTTIRCFSGHNSTVPRGPRSNWLEFWYSAEPAASSVDWITGHLLPYKWLCKWRISGLR